MSDLADELPEDDDVTDIETTPETTPETPEETSDDSALLDQPVIGEDELLGATAASDADGEEGEEGDDDEEEAVAVQQSPYDRPGAWYVVHTYAGYENKVKQNMASMTASLNMEDKVFEVVIPMEDVIDFKNGKRVVVQKKMFPGYLLVRADMDENVWFHIRNTPGVTGFVGTGAKPTPLSRRDVETFLAVKDEAAGEAAPKKTRPQTLYSEGDTVRVKQGPFADFTGTVAEINEDQLRLKVLVNIFGRETPVELGFDEVAKL
jgi:transcription termination/antitermination protein NusG